MLRLKQKNLPKLLVQLDDGWLIPQPKNDDVSAQMNKL